MVKLREAVYVADRNNTDVQGALNRLQAYVTAHMNTNLSSGPNVVYPPIQLKYTYDRLVQAAQNSSGDQTQNQLYSEAQHYCEQQNSVDFSGHNRVPCIEQYVQSHGGTSAPTSITIPAALYQFSFISPKWSPDLAGWSLIIAVLCWLLLPLVIIMNRWFRHHVA
jgi:hypothetical protein